MYLDYNMNYIHHLFNVPENRIFSYIWDRREYSAKCLKRTRASNVLCDTKVALKLKDFFFFIG